MSTASKFAAIFLSASLLAFGLTSRAAESIPPGTILPAHLNSTLSSAKAKPGQIVTARVMQDVPLNDGRTIRAGATIIGHITGVTRASNGNAARVSLRFDTLKLSHQRIPIITNVRAIASFIEVEGAQIPVTGPDRGTPPDAWTTTQIGGDAVYRGGGPVEGPEGNVGTPVSDGVLVRLNANPDRGCRGAMDANDTPQALWVFSSDACGTYGLPDLKIVQAGRSDPVGEIVLESTRGEVKVNGGAGLLLRVDSAGASSGV
ncbi:MAG TPA: hypothetical protein VHX36_03825 [Candidatus Acidoferrales bacterium]|jgi:hypothetical protein|nr:hypothetical protein [Candidatus Acidoferrales bacterium]